MPEAHTPESNSSANACHS